LPDFLACQLVIGEGIVLKRRHGTSPAFSNRLLAYQNYSTDLNKFSAQQWINLRANRHPFIR
jgi:hypothetical protein